MRDIVKEYQKKFRRNHQRARRYTALLLALALTTSLFVNWQLHGVGIAKTAEYLCGELEHEHTAACYEKQLVCGYEEGEPEDWNATMTDDDMSFDDTFDMDDDAFGVDADDPGIAAGVNKAMVGTGGPCFAFIAGGKGLSVSLSVEPRVDHPTAIAEFNDFGFVPRN